MVVKYLLFLAPLMASATNDTTTTTTAAPKVTKRFDLTCDVAMTCSQEERKEWTSSTDQTTGEVDFTQSVNLTARVLSIANGLASAIDTVAATLDLSGASLTVDKVVDKAISTTRRKLQNQALNLAVEYHITVELSVADAASLETTMTTKATEIGAAAVTAIGTELGSAYTVTGVVQSATVAVTTITTSTASSSTTPGATSTTSAAFQVVPALMTVVAVIMGTAF